MQSTQSWRERELSVPFTPEERKALAARVAAARVWTSPYDQDDSEDTDLVSAKSKGADHMRKLRQEALELSWEEMGFDGLTDLKIEAMLEHIRDTCATTPAAAIEVGIDPGLLRRWLQEGKRLAKDENLIESEDPIVFARRTKLTQLAMDITRAQNDPINAAAKTIITHARQGDMDASKFLLLNAPRSSQKWGKKTEVKHKGNVEHDHLHRPAPGSLGHLRGLAVADLEKRLSLASEVLERPTLARPTFDTVIDVDAEE